MSNPYEEGGRLHWIAQRRSRPRGRPRKNAPPALPRTTAVGVKGPGYFWAVGSSVRFATLVFVANDGTVRKVQATEIVDVSRRNLIKIDTPAEMGMKKQ